MTPSATAPMQLQVNGQAGHAAPASAPVPAPLDWDDNLLLGHAQMDATHQEFVHLVGQLAAASQGNCRARLQQLVGHTTAHFEAEQAWMDASAFPARECHAAEHAAVMASLQGVLAQVCAGDNARVGAIAQALSEWFPAHAHYMDAPLSQWLCRHRFGAAPLVLRRNTISPSRN